MSEINNFEVNITAHDIQSKMGRMQGMQIEGSNASVSAAQSEINKQLMVFLSKVQIGDVLKGQLMQADGKTLLQLQNGMQFSAECLQQVASDTLQEFLVVGKSRQHLQLQLDQSMPDKALPEKMLLDQVMEELGIHESPLAKETISQLIAKQLPLLKQQIVQVMQFAKNLEIPIEASTNLLSKQQGLSSEEGQMLMQYKENGAEIVSNQLEAMIKEVPIDQKDTLLQVLRHIFEPKEMISFLEKQGSFQVQTEGQPIDEETVQTEAKVSLDRSHEVLQGNHAAGSDLLKAMGDETFLLKLLEGKNINELKKIFKGMIKEHLTLHLDERESADEEVRKLSEGSEIIKKVTEQIKKADLEGIDQSKLMQMEKMGEVLEKYNMDAQYFCFPMQVNGEKAEGELYFFKPKKNKKAQQSGMYIVLALTMPHLNKIEIHVKENTEKVDLQLKVREPEIKALIEAHQEELQALIAETSFSLGAVTCDLMEKEIKEVVSSPVVSLTRLDARI